MIRAVFKAPAHPYKSITIFKILLHNIFYIHPTKPMAMFVQVGRRGGFKGEELLKGRQ
jgi:hypothetical protein